jgi:hypothetical protein
MRAPSDNIDAVLATAVKSRTNDPAADIQLLTDAIYGMISLAPEKLRDNPVGMAFFIRNKALRWMTLNHYVTTDHGTVFGNPKPVEIRAAKARPGRQAVPAVKTITQAEIDLFDTKLPEIIKGDGDGTTVVIPAISVAAVAKNTLKLKAPAPAPAPIAKPAQTNAKQDEEAAFERAVEHMRKTGRVPRNLSRYSAAAKTKIAEEKRSKPAASSLVSSSTSGAPSTSAAIPPEKLQTPAPEPAKPEPAKPEPAKPEPAKPEPAKPEPAKAAPAPIARPTPASPSKVVKPVSLPHIRGHKPIPPQIGPDEHKTPAIDPAVKSGLIQLRAEVLQAPKPKTSLDVHAYDSKWSPELKAYIAAANQAVPFETVVKEIEDRIVQSAPETQKAALRQNLFNLVATRKENADPVNVTNAEKILSLLWEKMKGTHDMDTSLFEQLADMSGGFCSQGRTTRLAQLLGSLLDNHPATKAAVNIAAAAVAASKAEAAQVIKTDQK